MGSPMRYDNPKLAARGSTAVPTREAKRDWSALSQSEIAVARKMAACGDNALTIANHLGCHSAKVKALGVK